MVTDKIVKEKEISIKLDPVGDLGGGIGGKFRASTMMLAVTFSEATKSDASARTESKIEFSSEVSVFGIETSPWCINDFFGSSKYSHGPIATRTSENLGFAERSFSYKRDHTTWQTWNVVKFSKKMSDAVFVEIGFMILPE